MKPLESYFPDVETCIKLKDAGFPQDAIFYWGKNPIPGETDYLLFKGDGMTENEPGTVAAPLTDEFLEVLPKRIFFEGDNYDITYEKDFVTGIFVWRYVNCDCRSIWINSKEVVSRSFPDLYLRLKKEGLV